MDRQGIPILLIPLLAAFALFYPSTRPTAAHEASSHLQRLVNNPFASEKTGPSKAAAWSNGREMVFNFLGAPKDNQAAWSDSDRRSNTKVEFLVATLPDPIESGLPHQFDRQFSSIQSALQGAAGQNFILTNFQLPWLRCLKVAGEGKGEKAQDDKAASANCGSNPAYASEPGVVLFSEPGAAAGNAGRKKANLPLRADTHLLLLYVVGETPTSGIHKAALTTALNEIAWFCGFQPNGDSRPRWLKGKADCENIRVIGPTFSGSAQSLDLALSTWMSSLGELPVASVNMISGSATAVQPWYDFLNLQRIFDKERLKGRSTRTFAFHSMQASSRTSFNFLLRYIKDVQPCGMRRRVALLSEGNTVYGQTTPQGHTDANILEGSSDPDSHPCKSETEVTSIPFPLHISQLRAALERVRSTQREATPKPATSNSEALPLDESLEEVNQRHDSVPPLSQLDTATAELIMSNLLTTISQEKYHYVGILATDVRDVIFLAREIRQHCPQTIIFAFNPDLLFLHPEENASLRGMLLVTTYPLFSFNQLWSAPFYASDALGADSPRARFQFPDQGAQGVYEATLASLGGDSEKQLLEFGIPFDDQKHSPDGYMRPPLWITVVGRNRMWPVRVYDLNPVGNARWYLNGVSAKSAGSPAEERQLWWRGLYPSGALTLLAGVSIGSLIFCGLALRQSRRSLQLRPPPRRVRPVLEPSEGIALLTRADEPAPRPHQGAAYLLSACASLTAFITVALSGLLVPMMVMFHVDAFHPPKWINEWGWALSVIVLTVVALSFLIYTSYVLIVGLVRQWKHFSHKKLSDEDHSSWVQIALGVAVIYSLCFYLGLSTMLQASPSGDFRAALFSSLRSLYLLSGVSPLLPVFLISMAGFAWALGSYFRVRALEAIESEKGFLPLGLDLAEISTLEKTLRALLHCSALSLPNAYIVVSLVMASGVYLCLAFVRSVESSALYLLLLFSFVLVNLVLWLGVLRFFCVARQMHHLLRQIAWTPLGPACGRLRKELPGLPKIDLASPAPTLSRLMYSVEYAQLLWRRAHSLLVPRQQELRLATAVGEGPLPNHSTESNAKTSAGPVLSATDVEALQSLSSQEFASLITEAETAWKAARDADASGNMGERTDKKAESQGALANVTTAVSQTLQASWWKKDPDLLVDQGGTTESPAAGVFRLGEDFLVGRLGSLLAHVLPQMQNLIATSVAGLLLMLLAVSSYPFEPHDILLLFNWAGILAFVAIAMWVFIQMNRDPVLSSLNDTTPGQISWNKEFVVRIVMYGIVPILALLGAQFPQSVGQLVSHFIPGDALHQ